MAVYIVALLLFSDLFFTIYASYHWVVTENGKIQTQVENSAFPLRRPYDLLSLLEQERRVSQVQEMYEKLSRYKVTVEHPWQDVDGATDLESKLYKHDIDCIISGKPLTEFNLNTHFLEYYDSTSILKQENNRYDTEPDCTKYSKLDFSMGLFHHLQSLNDRHNLTLVSDYELNTYKPDLDLSRMLHKNRTNWVVYNLASWYWRSKGNATNAVECYRRAIYFAPRDKRYIPLLNLGTLLQQLKSLGEAAIVLHSAVDHSPVQYLSHLALGNVYVALGDYNRSIACYENVLRLNPGFLRAKLLKHAVLCHTKLEKGLMDIHQTLQNMLEDLQKYHELQEKWVLLQNQINWERDRMSSMDHSLSHNLDLMFQKLDSQANFLTEEISKRTENKYQHKEETKVQRNKVKTESLFECDVDKCKDYKNLKDEVDTPRVLNIKQKVKIKPNDDLDSLMLFIKNYRNNFFYFSDVKKNAKNNMKLKTVDICNDSESCIDSLKTLCKTLKLKRDKLTTFKLESFNFLHSNKLEDYDWFNLNIDSCEWLSEELGTLPVKSKL